MKEVVLKIDVVNKVLNYLAQKPYIEVYELISELQKAETAEGDKNGITEN